MVIAFIASEESKQALLNERFIRIGLSKIYLEDFVKPHSDNHKDEECKEENKINNCLNCKKDHSTYYRGCSVYLEAKNDKLHKKHSVVSKEINSI